MKKISSLAITLLLALITNFSFAQGQVLTGKIISREVDVLNKISITVKGLKIGTTTGEDGQFSLTLPAKTKFPLTLVVSGIGITAQETIVTSAKQNLSIEVSSNTTMGDEIVVSATRTQTKSLESPVTIERVNLSSIRSAPSANYYDLVGNLKGVDLITSSLTFKTVTTRGFGYSGNTRFNQIVDGMDNQAPGLNFSVGSIIALSELDVENIELLPGASSALYGPGGMNGTLLMTSKNPFKYQGFSFQAKTGLMHTDSRYRMASPYHNWNMRWAQKVSDKFAFKVTAELVHAKDWVAGDNRNYIVPTAENGLAVGRIADGTRSTDPNYNGVNVYGDETSVSDIRPFLQGIGAQAPFLMPYINQIVAKGAIPVSRTGYKEADVIDPYAVNVKVGGSLNYRLSKNVELVLAGNFGTGNTVYSGSDRYSIKDFKMGQYKAELNGKNWLLRAYTTQENAGQSYNLTVVSRFLNEAWKPTVTFAPNGTPNPQTSDWMLQYAQAYLTGMLNGRSNTEAHSFARSTADVGRLEPGTAAYNEVYNKIRKTPISKGGGLLVDKTNLYAVEGQWNLSEYTKKFADILVGANFRRYVLNSQGTLFIDTAGVIPINEYGMYAQAVKDIFGGAVRLTLSGRYDKNENFKGRFTPRATALLKVSPKSNFRLSYQTAYRFPSTQNQYIRLAVGGGVLVGGLPIFQTIYNFAGNAPIQLPIGAAGPQVAKFAEYKPESVQSFEVGYKTLAANDKLLIDVYGYYGRYKDFLVRTSVGQKIDVNGPISSGNLKVLSISVNSTEKVSTYGGGMSFEYRLRGGYFVNMNASTDVLNGVGDNFVSYFNAPKYRFNTVLGNNGFGKDKKLSATATLRWQDDFYFQGDFSGGTVPSYTTIDAQVSYKFPETKSLFSLGANNITNQYYVNATGNPSIGGLYYVRFAYNIY
jgi:outer membrane receptor protein involved in Fe transport